MFRGINTIDEILTTLGVYHQATQSTIIIKVWHYMFDTPEIANSYVTATFQFFGWAIIARGAKIQVAQKTLHISVFFSHPVIIKVLSVGLRECKSETVLFPPGSLIPECYANYAYFTAAEWSNPFSSANQACSFFVQIFLPHVRTWNAMAYHIYCNKIVVFSV